MGTRRVSLDGKEIVFNNLAPPLRNRWFAENSEILLH
jgi:hypothetical protein